MSTPSPLSNESVTRSNPETETTHEHGLRRYLEVLRGPTQFVSFWAAVALPFVLLTLLASGLESGTTVLVFISLLVVNVVALYAGHEHNQP